MNTDKSIPASGNSNPQSSSPPAPQVARRDFIKASAFGALAAAGAAFLPQTAQAQEEPAHKARTAAKKKKTFVVCQGHMDDAYIGAGGLFIKLAKAGHRVVFITTASDLSSWEPTADRVEETNRKLDQLAADFGFERRLTGGKYHQTQSSDRELKRKLADIYNELQPDACFVSHHEDHWPDHRESGLAAKDAFMFSHGLASHTVRAHRASLVLGFQVTPHETYHFDPDVYYDVSDVMPEYMDLIARVETTRDGSNMERDTRFRVETAKGTRPPMPLTPHGLVGFAQAARFGNASTHYEFAVGMTVLYGDRNGAALI